MRFAKWQALGNDYVIVERDELPWPLTAQRARLLCDRQFGVGADGVLVLSRGASDAVVADLRIVNADGSDAELSGNGAREAILYLRHVGWTDADEFMISTPAGELRPTILSERECRVAMGRAELGERGQIGRRPFQHLRIGNPQTTFRLDSRDELEALDLQVLGPPIEHDARFPGRTNVSWYVVLDDGRLRARIFERGVGETTASGTGACGAAVDHVHRGGGSPVTVVLDGGELVVEVSAELDVALTGWAESVYEGELSAALLARLADA